MTRTAGRFVWLMAAVLDVCVLSVGQSPAQPGDEAACRAAFARGKTLQKEGKYKEAAASYETALELAPGVFGRDDANTAAILNNLASLYADMGQYARAEPLFQRSLKIEEDKLGKDHPDVAGSLNNLANLYQHMGQYAKAESLYQRSLRINEDKLGKDHPDTAMSLNNLATLYKNMGQFAKAEPLFLRSLEIKKDKLGKNHPDTATSLHNLAGLYHDMGQYAKAEPLYLRCLQIREDKLGKNHPDTAATLNNLATLYRDMGQSAKAESLYQRSLKINEDRLGKDHPDLAKSLNNLAILYKDMGQYEKAEPLYQRSLQILEDKLGKHHPGVGGSLNNLAALYQDMGQYEKAEPLYQRSLKIKEDKLGKEHPDVAVSLNNLALLYAGQGRWKEAVEAADQERRIVRRIVARLLPTLPEKEQLAFLEHEDLRAFHIVESVGLAQRGRTGTAALSASWVLNGKAVAQEALAQRTQAALDARDLIARPATAGGHALRAEPWVELAEVRKALADDAVLVEISKFNVSNFEAKNKDKKWLGYRYAAWIIRAEGYVQVVDLGPAAPIEDAVTKLRQALKEAQGSPKHPGAITQDGEPEAEQAILKPLRELSRLVLEPLGEYIDGKKRWYVSPDASLWLIPWAALPLKDGRYAIEAHTISYLVSGRDLAAAPSEAKPGRPRMMADPDYDLGIAEARAVANDLIGKRTPDPSLRGASPAPGAMRARRLPGTALEAKAIQPALKKYAGEEAWLYQQDKALEGVFKTFHGPRVLVLSTHGFFLEDQVVAPSDKLGMEEKRPALDKEGLPLENPLLRCGLLLAGCNNRDQAREGDEDGVLTGLEVAGTDLRGTELVVLSACETGLGEVHNGEGVAGLRQAFQLAGARAVAATLWQIPDRESAKLIGDFFAHLGDGKDKAEALREAQLAMIRTRREKNAAAHPFFWAAYTLTGQ